MKKYFVASISIFTLFTLANAQHEGCNHGDAPHSDVTSSARLVQIPHSAEHNINLKTEKAEAKNIDVVINALGTAQNIPELQAQVSSRIAGKVVELYVKPDEFVKKGAPIAKIESLLFGNPPPSTTLYAQISGVVESLNVSLGTPVSQNDVIAKIVDTSKIYAVANVWETAVGQLKIGQTARIKFEAYPNKIYIGKLVKFATVLDDETSTLATYFEIDNPDGLIKQSMRASFSIIVDNTPAKVAINKSALLGGHGNYSAFVQVCPNDKIYERRDVVLGKSDDTHVEILHGINTGDVVATNGAYQLQFMPPAKEHDHKQEKKHQHNVEEKHDHAKHAHQEEAHKHEDHAHKEETHKHSENCKHDHSHADESIFSHFEMTPEYKQSLIKCLLGASLLLNIIFILATFFGKRKDDTK